MLCRPLVKVTEVMFMLGKEDDFLVPREGVTLGTLLGGARPPRLIWGIYDLAEKTYPTSTEERELVTRSLSPS